jgi:hypothetical protein
MWKKLGIATGLLAGLILLLGLACLLYVRSLDLDQEPMADPAATVADLDFLAARPTEQRGRILAVVSSAERFPDGRRAGYELTELSRAYWVFVANGYEVDIASPRGGEPPMVKDDDLVEADYAFLNDPAARARLTGSLPLAQVDSSSPGSTRRKSNR